MYKFFTVKAENLRNLLEKMRPAEGFRSSIKKYINFFLIRKIQHLILPLNVRHIYGLDTIDYGPDELIVLCLVRDGQLYMKSFIEHYFSLGVKHIVFLDNNSIDDTVSIAQDYENVTILQTKLPFKSYRVVMKQYLITRFAKTGRWALCVDIDELFDYPFSDVLTLCSLLNHLNEHSYTTVVAYILDMFSDKSLLSQKSKKDDSLKDIYRWYDTSNITKRDYYPPQNILSNPRVKSYYGGIREAIFGTDVCLIKHPLVFLDGKIKPIHPNEHRASHAHVADFTCVLFHYKFLGDFYEHTLQAVREENHYQNSAEYKSYLRVLKQNPNLKIKQKTSNEIKNVNDLIDNGFLVISEDYENLVQNCTQ